ncbi:cache domain-containing sensor histidine kinase [Bacillus sp. SD088]|uniref:cache domain-containing sensor histidine kinase n=1 Tax=Bacillus sp. SD088 TaxID=2782012 RepID=UPI001A95887D|nr:sensor histidine kinase [Bacillus sp. SD088]MBO0993205.1 sensor histidine kinase [Bacillus sp. SD088]
MWKRLNSSFKTSIQLKLTVYFLLTLAPLIFISVYSNIQSYKVLKQQLSKQATSVMHSEVEYIDMIMQNIDELSVLISTDQTINHLLNQTTSELTPASILDLKQILDKVTKFSDANNYISNISIFHTSSKTMLSSEYGGKRGLNIEQESWFQQTMEANGQTVLVILPRTEEEHSNSIFDPDDLIFMRLLDINNPVKNNNILAISVPQSKFLHFANEFAASNHTQFYLFSNEGKLLSTTVKNNKIQTETELQHIQEGDFFKIDVSSPYSHWNLVMIQPKDEFYKELDTISLFTIFIISLSFLLAIWTSWLVYKTIASPLGNLSQGMKRLKQGELNIQLKEGRKDEFGYLTTAFNQMALEQKHLIKDIYEKQLRMTKTELKFLQSQINPHFLYNTLDSVYWMAKDHNAEEISEMVFNLSKFFRLNLMKADETVSLEEEIKHLHYYIRIQQIRFMDHFEVDYKIAENTKYIPVIKLLLQPLIENAILHGLERRKSKGILTIETSIVEDRLKVDIIDNGIGIRIDRLRYILDELNHITIERLKNFNNYQEFKPDVFGLRNVKSRLKLFYGDQGDLFIDSKENEGTVVTIYIPFLNFRNGSSHPNRSVPY